MAVVAWATSLACVAMALSACTGPPPQSEESRFGLPYEFRNGSNVLRDGVIQGLDELRLHGAWEFHNVHIAAAGNFTLSCQDCEIRGHGFTIAGDGFATSQLMLDVGRDTFPVLDGVRISDFGTGLFMTRAAGGAFSNITMDCLQSGFSFPLMVSSELGPPRLSIVDSTVRGCQGSGFVLWYGDLFDPDRAEVLLERVQMVGNGRGVLLLNPNATRLEVRDSSFLGNREQAIHAPDSLDARPADTAWLNVSDSWFLANGNQCQNECDPGAIVGDIRGSVHGSAFVGNSLALDVSRARVELQGGVASVGAANPDFDATLNWWGDPLGPRMFNSPIGSGDKVNGWVPTVPFLTSPPHPP